MCGLDILCGISNGTIEISNGTIEIPHKISDLYSEKYYS